MFYGLEHVPKHSLFAAATFELVSIENSNIFFLLTCIKTSRVESELFASLRNPFKRSLQSNFQFRWNEAVVKSLGKPHAEESLKQPVWKESVEIDNFDKRPLSMSIN